MENHVTYLDGKMSIDVPAQRLECRARKRVRAAVPANVDKRVELGRDGRRHSRHDGDVEENKEVCGDNCRENGGELDALWPRVF